MFGVLETIFIFGIAMLAYVVCEIIKWFIKNQPVWVSWIVVVVIAFILIFISILI